MAAALGCGGGPSLVGPVPDPIPAAGDYHRTLVSDGFERSYEVHVPPSWRPGIRLPVVLALHGIGSDAEGMRKATAFDTYADREGFVSVYPQAYADWATGCEACGSGATLLRIDDVRFLRELLGRLDLDLGIDRTRIVAAGLSNGALMVHRLACDEADVITGFVSVAATMLDPRFVPVCAPSRAATIVFVHGTADTQFPPEGRSFGAGPGDPRALSIQETVAAWAALDRCAPSPAVTDLPDTVADGTTVRRSSYAGCSDGAAVAFYEVTGGGHAWPGSAVGGALGAVSRDLDASQLTVDLLFRRPLPSVSP